MEITSVSAQSSALQAYAAQRQAQRLQDPDETVGRPESAEPVGPGVDRVSLSQESRNAPVGQAQNSPRPNETERTGEARTQRREEEGRSMQAANNAPRAVSQALEAYSQVSKT